jgi:hypothetical protein
MLEAELREKCTSEGAWVEPKGQHINFLMQNRSVFTAYFLKFSFFSFYYAGSVDVTSSLVIFVRIRPVAFSHFLAVFRVETKMPFSILAKKAKFLNFL